MDNDQDPSQDIQGAIEALLNIAAQAAEMQVTEEGREAVYAILNLVAEHFDIEIAEVVEEELEDGSIHVTFKEEGRKQRPKLSVIQGGISLLDDTTPDDDDSVHWRIA